MGKIHFHQEQQKNIITKILNKMNKQTAMQELLQFCEYRHTKAADGCKSAWNMILAKIKDDGLLEREKDQIMNSWVNGVISDNNMTAEDYYNKTFKN